MLTVGEWFCLKIGGRVQKIAVNAGLECPNRDGVLSREGCIYCNNASFNPAYAHECQGSITEQIDKGIRFFSGKYDHCSYLAYFQAFSNTYGDTEKLVQLYEEALTHPQISGLVIATRPDCLKEDLLEYFQNRFGDKAPSGHPFLLIEIGVESTKDETLKRINRGHDYACAENAIRELDRRGIAVGVHLILGLPGECETDWAEHIRRISALPVSTLKLHQLQIIKGTPLAEEYLANPEAIRLFTAEEYASTVALLLKDLREDIAIDRVVSEAPKDLLIAPAWGMKPSEFGELLKRCLGSESPELSIITSSSK